MIAGVDVDGEKGVRVGDGSVGMRGISLTLTSMAAAAARVSPASGQNIRGPVAQGSAMPASQQASTQSAYHADGSTS